MLVKGESVKINLKGRLAQRASGSTSRRLRELVRWEEYQLKKSAYKRKKFMNKFIKGEQARVAQLVRAYGSHP